MRITSTVTDKRQVLLSGKRLGMYFGRLADARVREAAEGARTELSIPAARPAYPISWDSERQRRAFFASGGFGRGIPTERTGAYVGGFKVERAALRSYTLINRSPGARYVGGNARGKGQSSIHRGRWPLAHDVAMRWAAKLLESVNADLARVIRGEGASL